jgi:hypothetical protein
MTQIPIQHITTTPTQNSTDLACEATTSTNVVGIGTVLPGRENNDADIATIKLLHEVEARRRQLRVLEPQLSKMITEFGWRRGWSGYREFFLRNELNAQTYKER